MRPRRSSNLKNVEWDRLFEDLEDQLASGWEAERAALDAEAERVRIARLELRSRLATMASTAATVSLTLRDSSTLNGRLRGVGGDWVVVEQALTPALVIVPIAAVLAWSVDHPTLLASGMPAEGLSPLRERMTLGFLLRDLARRRVGVTVRISASQTFSGTIDRAGADHLDLALHDLDQPRRAQAVRGFRMIPFDALISVIAGSAALGSMLG